MSNKIKSVDDVLTLIKEKLYLKGPEHSKEIKEVLQEEYDTIITLEIKSLDEEVIQKHNLFSTFTKENLIPGKTNIDDFQEKIIKKLNEQEEIKGYSFLPEGLGHYENITGLMNQLLRQSTLEEKKYIFAVIKDQDIIEIEEKIRKLIKDLKNTLFIILGTKNKEQPIYLLWHEKEKKKDWVIRHLEEKEYSEFIHTFRDFAKIYTRNRPDIFDIKNVYQKQEFYNLCNPHQLKILLVYEEDKNMLGFIEGEVTSTMIDIAYRDKRVLKIKKLYVKKEARRKKIGTKLYQAMIEKGKEEKCDRMEIKVYNFTPEAKLFFESFNLDILSYQYEYKF